MSSKKLFWSYFILVLIGLLQVYSSSSIYALEHHADSFYFLKKQALFALIGVSLVWLAAKIEFKYWQILGYLMFFAALGGTVMTLIEPWAIEVGGAKRWLQVYGGFRVQPGEFLKVAYAFLILGLLRFKESNQEQNFWWPFVAMTLGSIFVFIKQPDFGSVVLLVASLMIFVFLYVRRLVHFLYLVPTVLGALCVAMVWQPYRLDRVRTFLDPWADAQGKGFQTIQSFVALKKGGIFGAGIGSSKSKYFFLPEAHTDFSLAIFAEEYGFIGVVGLSLLFMLLIFEMLKVSKNQSERPKMLIGYYLAALFFFHFLINLGVNFGMLPAKGLPLPFLSYGGSSFLALSFLVGTFMSLSRSVNSKWL